MSNRPQKSYDYTRASVAMAATPAFILRTSCPLCGAAVPATGERFCIRQFDMRVRMVECPACGLVYKDHRPSEASLRTIYSANYGHLRGVPALRDRSMIEHVHRMGDMRGRRHLDYGCGNGSLVLHARALGLESYGSDPFLTETSGLAHPDWLFRKDARRLAEESPTRYDAISLWSVLEHLEHPLQDVRHLARCLKPGGRLYFDAPNADSLIARKCGANWGSALLVEHLTFWTPKAIQHLAKQTGLEVLRVKRSGIPYPLGKRVADERSFGVPIATGTEPAAPAPGECAPKLAKQAAQRLLTLCRQINTLPVMGSVVRKVLDATGIGDQVTVVLGRGDCDH